MNSYIEQFAHSIAERYTVLTDSHQGMVKLQCFDKAGQLIGTRVFNEKHLKNSALVCVVLADLKLELYKHGDHPPLTPLPETLHPSAS